MVVESYSNDDVDGNDDINWLISKTATLHVNHFLVHVFVVHAVLSMTFHVLWKTWTDDDELSCLFLNLAAFPKNSAPENRKFGSLELILRTCRLSTDVSLSLLVREIFETRRILGQPQSLKEKISAFMTVRCPSLCESQERFLNR